MRSGGEFDFNVLESERAPTITSVSSGANTGIPYFGLEYFAVSNQLSTNVIGPDANEFIVFELVITLIVPDNYNDILNRNFELGQQVPGFIPAEGLPLAEDSNLNLGATREIVGFPYHLD
jgi:hypothetical protein